MSEQESWSCVKSCLLKYIRLTGSPRQAFISQIQLNVYQLSRIFHRGSLFLRLHLLRLLEEHRDLPDFTNQNFYYKCLTIGIANHRKLDPEITESYHRFSHLFPPLPVIPKEFKSRAGPCRINGDTEAIQYLATKMKTNFLNHIKEPFFGRQFAMLSSYLGDKALAKKVQDMINNVKPWDWNLIKDLPKPAQEVLYNHKLFFQTNEHITKLWLNKHLHYAVYYTYSIQQNLAELGKANFSIAPIVNIKSHFITIDNKVLCYIMKNAGIFAGDYETFKDNLDDYWRQCFKIEKYGLKKHFGNIIETDGISLITKFHNHWAQTDNNDTEIDYEELVNSRIIAFDPGRTTLLHGVEFLPDGSIREYKLSKKQYYHEGHINLANQRAKWWKQDIQEIENQLSQTTQMTPSSIKLIEYIHVYNQYVEQLWTHYTQEKYARNRMDTYIHKRKCLDKFVQSLHQKGEDIPVIAMGNANFAPTGPRSTRSDSGDKECM